MCDLVECGYLWVEPSRESLEIVEIALLPEFQNRGIGRQVLEEEMARALARNGPVALQVLRENRAVSLYSRLGFREVDRTETHIQMRWDGPGTVN